MYRKEKEENLRKIRRSITGENGGYADYFPRYMQIEHTTFCNAECVMCNHFFLGNKGAGSVSQEIISRLEPVLPYCELIMMNGDGEPFMCRELEKYLALYKKYGVMVSMNTNLCACDSKRLTAAMEYLDYLNISCDGVTQRTFELIRKGLSFGKFLENLGALRRAFPEKRLNLDMVVMSHNLREVPDAVDFAAEHGFSAVQLNMMNPNPLIGNNEDSILRYPEAAAYFLGRAAENAKRHGILLKAPFFLIREPDQARLETELRELENLSPESVIEKRFKNAQALRESSSLSSDHLSILSGTADLVQGAISAGRECSWALERCYIDIMGNVTTCCFNVHHYMGNILEAGSFEAVWNGEYYRRMRMQMAEGMLPEWCRGCSWFNGSCGGLEKGTAIPL